MLLAYGKGKPGFQACHGTVFSNPQTVKHYFTFYDTTKDKGEIEGFVKFMNDCGFKCTLVFKKESFSKPNPYSKGGDSDFYIEYDPEDYINTLHWKVACTAIRTLFYNSNGTLTGGEHEIKNPMWNFGLDAYRAWNGKKDAYKHFISFYKTINKSAYNFYTGNHHLVSESDLKTFTPITREQLEEQIRTHSLQSVNKVSIKM